jgi:hypothetical protein
MAHPKFNLGNERPLPSSLIEQARRVDNLKQPGASTRLTEAPEVDKSRQEPEQPAREGSRREATRRRETPGTPTDVIATWMREQNTERIVLENGPSRVVLQSPFVWDNETTIAFAFDPKLIAFSPAKPFEPESMVTMELTFESHVKLRYREGDIDALFAGGLFLFPGLPFGIVSFFKTKPEETS